MGGWTLWVGGCTLTLWLWGAWGASGAGLLAGAGNPASSSKFWYPSRPAEVKPPGIDQTEPQ